MHKTTISTRNKIAIAVAVFTTLGATATAYAQSAGLEEIIVTATRKSESLQAVGMAITSLGHEEICLVYKSDAADDMTR